MDRPDLKVPQERLRPRWDPEQFSFHTTEELLPAEAPGGQERALAAFDVGLCARDPRFHVFVSGPAGTGRSFALRKRLEALAPGQPTPPDWCYLHNFRDPDRPIVVALPPGRGRALERDLDDLIEGGRTELPRAFESDAYRQRREAVERRFQERRSALLDETARRAMEQGFMLQFTPSGFMLVALRDGEPLSAEEVEKLSPEEREAIRRRGEEVETIGRDTLHRLRRLQKEEEEEVERLNHEVAAFAVGHLIDELLERYGDQPRIQEHLRAIREDVLEHFQDFLTGEAGPPPLALHLEEVANRYRANVVVDNGETEGAPVLFENNPTYYNLLGRIDYRARFGMMVTDFTMIKSGALQRANGGYLVLDALQVLRHPFAWDALMRTLRTRQARIENIAEQFGLVPTETLKPEPIPLSATVVLLGEPFLYYLLYALDPDFRELFRIKADFDSEIPRTPENVLAYARYIATLCREQGLRHFDRGAVARLVEHGARLAGHQEKLTAHLLSLAALAREASFWAEREESPHVAARHVERAIAQQEYRCNLLEEKLQERIVEGTILIDTEGRVVGQVNGLSVYDLGDYAFARPVRVTARTSLGAHGVVDIEREAELGGRIHSKGVLILAGYLAHRFAQDKPLALSASLAFEQSYAEVEGDSASSAELYALLSSLADVPLRQDIAVTGSVNQRGEIQPVGGVTLKIEGFFRVCQARGLTGEQGVLIPAGNVRHLALKEEVARAIEEGRFHLWAIRTVDEGLELLTGMPAGERGPDGRYPEESVNGRVDRTLRGYAERLREFGGALAAGARGDGRRPHARRVPVRPR